MRESDENTWKMVKEEIVNFPLRKKTASLKRFSRHI